MVLLKLKEVDHPPADVVLVLPELVRQVQQRLRDPTRHVAEDQVRHRLVGPP